MRKIAVLMSLVASTVSWAGERTVTVCLAHHPEVYRIQGFAQGYASRLYHAIGIELRWKGSCAKAEEEAPGTPFAPNLTTLGIEWAPRAPATMPAGVRASARPFQPTGRRITLYLDRLQTLWEDPSLAAAVLGHVLAHEIGHVLLGYDGHAPEGLMKATWSAAEQSAMVCRPMPFTGDEGERLRQRLDRRSLVLTATR